MILLTMIEHKFTPVGGGVGQDVLKNHSQRTMMFATNYKLEEAIRRIKSYEMAYRSRYRGIVFEFTLIGIQTLSDSAFQLKKHLNLVGVELIEDLQQKAEDFNAD